MGEMLEKIQVIDECDHVAQQLRESKGIHVALVNLYSNMLEFYGVACAHCETNT